MQVDDVDDDVRAAFEQLRGGSDTPATAAPAAASTVKDQPAETSRPVETARTVDTSRTTEPVDSKATPAKDAKGRFARRDAGEKTTDQPDPAAPSSSESEHAVSTAAPPPSWGVKAKAAWDNLPGEVRTEIAKREGEVAQGLAALRDYKDLKPYAELATKHNTTIAKALDRYIGIENVLKRDLGAGLAQILENHGMNQAQAAQYFSTLAQRFGGGGQPATTTPTTTMTAQPQPNDPLHSVLRPVIDPLLKQITALEQKFTSQDAAHRTVAERSLGEAITAFSGKPENRYFPDLEETITRLFETGMVKLTGDHERDLRTAYDTAASMHPEVREALIEQRLATQDAAKRQKEQEEAQRARQASRSLTGSRAAVTVTPPAARANGHDDILADVTSAYRSVSRF